MTPAALAAKIDHTILKPEALAPDVHRVVTEALQNGCASACVAPAWLARTVIMLRGSATKACTVIGFPHGTSKPTVKAIECVSAVKDGADEIDIVAFLPHLLNLDLDRARAELIECVRGARAARKDVVIKVIVESAALMAGGPEEGEKCIEVACRAVRESGCDYIKTSTGIHPAGGASVEAVRLMKKYGDGLQIKASGGIRDLATCRAMLEAGADRLGLSGTVPILAELRKIPQAVNTDSY